MKEGKADASTLLQKKRGRKPREKVYSVNTSVDEDKISSEESNESIILYLPVSSADLESESPLFDKDQVPEYDPVLKEPSPYSPDVNAGPFYGKTGELVGLEKENVESVRRTVEFEDKKSGKLIRNTMCADSSDDTEIFTGSEVCCWWCCHNFEMIPVRLPVSLTNGVYEVYGHFCSYNCACSYLFSAPEYSDKIWHIYSLLNLMYKKIHGGEARKVRLAPPRQDLKMFGGSMTIEDFRTSNQKNDREFRLLIPPMTMVISQVEESKMDVDQDETIPVNRYKMQEATKALKIKRSKPILDHKHTLNSFMPIKRIAT